MTDIIILPKRRQERGGTAANLATVNEVLLAREWCVETDTRKVKIGDGVTAWNALPYVGELANLGNPAGDRLVYWDDAANAFAFLSLGTGLTIGSGGDLDVTGGGGGGISALTGDVTASGSGSVAATIAANAVTYSKMQDVSATARVIGRKTAGSGDPEELTLSDVLDLVGSAAQGDILYRGASSWTRLPAGTSGYVLTTAGTGANPSWTDPAAAGVNATARSIFLKTVAWWERDETSGTVMVDAHNNSLNGTYSGLTVNQTGLAANLDKSVTFPAGNNYAEVANDALLSPLFNMACMVWVKRNGTQGNFPKLLWKPGGSKAGGQATYLLQQDNSSNGGKAMFRVTTAAGSNVDVLTTSALADLTVYQLIGNRVNNETSIWRNATKEGTSTGMGSNPAATATDALRFGYHGTASDAWIGSQDQAAVFSDYLTPTEIAYLYNSGSGVSYATMKSAAGF